MVKGEKVVIDTAYSDIYEPEEHLMIAPDPDDNKLIECASAAKAKYIITGDRSLASLNEFGRIKILTPSEFLLQIMPIYK